MRRLAIVVSVIVLAATGTARADRPAQTLVGVGIGAPGVSLGAELVGELAIRPTDDPWRVHVLVGDGKGSQEDFVDSTYFQIRAGIEDALCSDGGTACSVFDLDAGFLSVASQTYLGNNDSMPITPKGLLVAGRAGFDVGNPNIRFRLMLDIAHAVTGDFTARDWMGGDVHLAGASAIEAEVVVGFD